MAKVILQNVRIAFPAIFNPKVGPAGGEPKFNAVFILDPKSANAKTLDGEIVKAANEKWGAKAAAILKDLRSKDRVCYRQSAKTNASGDTYDGFESMHYVNAASATRPLVLDRNKSPLDAKDGRPYGGCFVNAVLDVYAIDKPGEIGKRMCATLKSLQFVGDGEAFGGGAPATADDYEELPEKDLAS